MESDRSIHVEVAYARPEVQLVIPLEVPLGTTVEEAIERSGITSRFSEIDLDVNKVGVFGELVGLTDRLRAGDRVEIYRPLSVDPKEARRRRAAADRSCGAGGRWPVAAKR